MQYNEATGFPFYFRTTFDNRALDRIVYISRWLVSEFSTLVTSVPQSDPGACVYDEWEADGLSDLGHIFPHSRVYAEWDEWMWVATICFGTPLTDSTITVNIDPNTGLAHIHTLTRGLFAHWEEDVNGNDLDDEVIAAIRRAMRVLTAI